MARILTRCAFLRPPSKGFTEIQFSYLFYITQRGLKCNRINRLQGQYALACDAGGRVGAVKKYL